VYPNCFDVHELDADFVDALYFREHLDIARAMASYSSQRRKGETATLASYERRRCK
jgi:hypothetical protein